MTQLPTFVDFYRTAYPDAFGELRLAGGLGAGLFEMGHGPGNWSGPATSDLSVTLNVGEIIRTRRVDLGAGRIKGPLSSGGFIVTSPGAVTEIQVDSDHEVLILTIPYEGLLVSHRHAGLPDDGDFGCLHTRMNVDPELPQLMARLWGAMRGVHAGSALLSDALVLQIVSRLVDLADRNNRPTTGGLAPWQVRASREMINDRLGETVTLAELASAVGLSPSHFCRAFAETVGVTPHRAQVLARLDQARALLAAGRQPITEIALDCGYQSSQAFSRVFRKEVGTTPAAYRREAQG